MPNTPFLETFFMVKMYPYILPQLFAGLVFTVVFVKSPGKIGPLNSDDFDWSQYFSLDFLRSFLGFPSPAGNEERCEEHERKSECQRSDELSLCGSVEHVVFSRGKLGQVGSIRNIVRKRALPELRTLLRVES